MNALIKVEQIKKEFGKKRVIHKTNLTLNQPAIVGLVGANGAGKTTLLKLIAGQLKPSGGQIEINGHAPFQSLAAAEQLIFINHATPIGQTTTVKDLFLQANRSYEGWDQELAERLLDYFDISYPSAVSQLSKGKQSLVRSLLGICSHCPITLLDEPTNGMDGPTREGFHRALLKSNLQKPRLFLVSSHHLNEIDAILDHILYMNNGQLLLSLSKERAEQYATGISGSKEAVFAYIANKTVLYTEVFDERLAYSVVLTEDIEKSNVLPHSLTQSKVAITDLFRYLSDSVAKGGS
ncbi:ABC-2 type transport system ATP-binding protein [Alkalihalobacillus xiaoxiensis]|uniref:ABC-2 type transport system ATP-binding protein n=1 Tax=Shouchella xiaoxiensis TaxID=766895 RepID=A0ABS2SZN8_9BACI|nr:ABC-2 type transport system ATP-binding protein [Shouchella xiaoxiensis]